MAFWARLLLPLLLASCDLAAAFGWTRETRARLPKREDFGLKSDLSASQILRTGQRTLNTYETALEELRQLESEPLCHRTAARLLVNNCQLLEGKDEATVLTDSGRQVRDFVDAYAASLAICDLERGSFIIPHECDKFRESVLVQLTLQDSSYLHVSSGDIDSCLSGLGASDSAWNTWVSYRHKALRFCEAARAENEKAEHIHLFQRLTTIIRRMADGVEDRIEQRMTDADSRAQAVSDRISKMSPKIDALFRGLANIEDIILSDLGLELKKRSSETLNQGTNSAINLQQTLEVLMQTILNANAELSSTHERSMEVVTLKAETEMATFVSGMSTVMASVTAFRDEMELARLQAAELEQKQAGIELGMMRLASVTESLSQTYEQHSQRLNEAHNTTNEILGTLEDMVISTATMSEAILQRTSHSSWWPYIWCPAASLVMGSYGLPPSAARNLGLVVLGEVAGFIISSVNSLSAESAAWGIMGSSFPWSHELFTASLTRKADPLVHQAADDPPSFKHS